MKWACTDILAGMNALTVFYSPRMAVPSESYSPSSEKPAQVLASWRRLGVPLDVREPVAATAHQLALAHDPRFVADVLACRTANGFGNCSRQVAATLPLTTGAMLAAARHALKARWAAIAPVSGFHHAAYDRASGFCTFNGLMVTAAVLHAEGVRRIGILDCDHHYGDGTDAIIEQLEAHAWVHHVSIGATFDSPRHAAKFRSALDGIVNGFGDCDVVLYQAGADPHVDDPLGGWLTTEQLRERDARVFAGLKRLGVPVAWNLAGGYQRDARGGISPVLAIHDNTLRECAAAFLHREVAALG